MRELALFAGAGGGLLASKLLGWRTVCAVEIDDYCRDVLCARQNDGSLEPFPVWDDVRTFDGREWRGFVDVVSGGFPCQPFSTAARGRNNAIDLWPEMLRVIRESDPRFVLAENVQRAPIEAAARDLRLLGFGCAIVGASAASVGAPHRRPRWWLVADAYGEAKCVFTVDEKVAGLSCFADELWAEPGAEVLGMDDGLADRMDRLRAIGNGQVPQLVADVWRTIVRT